MRQVLGKTGGVTVARMPRPVVAPKSVLVRVHYSFISAGTEVGAIAPPVRPEAPPLEKGRAYASLARMYLGKAARDPKKATERLARIARQQIAKFRAEQEPKLVEPGVQVEGITWEKQAATEICVEGEALSFIGDDSPGLYQVMASPIAVPSGNSLVLKFDGEIEDSPISLGVLSGARDRWLGTITLSMGKLDDRVAFEVDGEREVVLVFANANTGKSAKVSFSRFTASTQPPSGDGLPMTELHQVGWNLGYSVAGEVVAIGEGVTEFKPGDKVACGGAGSANHADYVCVSRNLVCRVPEGCSLQAASSIAIGSIAMQGVRRAQTQIGETVCVIGLGLIGLISIQMLRAAGCRVIGFDIDEKRVKRAMEFGLHHGVNDENDLLRLLRDKTDGHGADVTLITAATKSDKPINLSMEATRMKGRVVIVGDIGLSVERAMFYRKEIDLLMSTSYGPGRYDKAYESEGIDYPFGYVRWTENRNMQAFLSLISTGSIDMDGLIDWIVPVTEAEDAYDALLKKSEQTPVGIVLQYPEDRCGDAIGFSATKIDVQGHGRIKDDAVKYVLVGAGGFGVATLVPTFAKYSETFQLYGVVSRDAVRGGNVVRQFRAKVLASEMTAVLDDDQADLFVIATRHNEHADQVIAALKAGKNVFVEKPLAITWEDLDKVIETYQELGEKAPLVMVGFNRRFSPALMKLREVLVDRSGPVIMNYRLNGGYIPLDHWVHGEQGGGRNIGEACHMYDVFRSISGAPVSQISAQAIDPKGAKYLRSDNFMATLSYDDGSMGTLIYTALGPKKGMGKEYLEVFCDGEAYILDDYKVLYRCSDGKVLWSSDTVDKGHATEIKLFGDSLKKGIPAPISFAEIVETTSASLHIEDLLNSNIET
jgi:predicted dehydrogenase/threonine dehydrogenase-like Zn-dependent dehydrogenase